MLNIEDYREHYNLYFKEFNRLAVGEYADLSYGNDKPNPTASSLESIIAYANYIWTGNVGTGGFILNAGAGVSSWVLRVLFKKVICIDPNERYLSFIELLCELNGLNADNFENGFHAANDYYITHCYYDYGDIHRLPYLGRAIDIADISIYADDTDVRSEALPYRNHVIKLCEAMNLKWFDCKDSLDSHGRAGIIIEK